METFFFAAVVAKFATKTFDGHQIDLIAACEGTDTQT